MEQEERFSNLAKQLLDKATEISKYPLIRKTVVNLGDKQLIIVEPMKWSLRVVPMLSKSALQLTKYSMYRKTHKYDAITALEVLVDEGWCSQPILIAAKQGVDKFERELKAVCRVASGLERLEELEAEELVD